MSKVVTIPKDRNPFVVIVNGVKHSYPAGESIEVPDEVADVIEKYVGAKPKPDPNAGGGVSWNDMKDKPFWESPTGGDTLYWDGNTEGLASVIAEPTLYFKVSDVVPTIEEIGTKYTIQFDNGESIPVGSFMEMGSGVLAHSSYFLVIVPEMGAGVDLGGISFPESGIYFGQEVTDENSVYVASFTIPGYTGFPVTKKIEEKYLPGAVILSFDINAQPYYLYKSDGTRLTSAELREMTEKKILIKNVVEMGGTKMEQYIYPSTIVIQNGIGMLSAYVANEAAVFYTAEYTAS